MPPSVPTADELRLLDPDGGFIERLTADRLLVLAAIDHGRPYELGPLIHRLAGAAGTFGFSEIGDLAITLDEAVVAGHKVTAADAARLAASIADALKNPEKSA